MSHHYKAIIDNQLSNLWAIIIIIALLKPITELKPESVYWRQSVIFCFISIKNTLWVQCCSRKQGNVRLFCFSCRTISVCWLLYQWIIQSVPHWKAFLELRYGYQTQIKHHILKVQGTTLLKYFWWLFYKPTHAFSLPILVPACPLLGYFKVLNICNLNSIIGWFMTQTHHQFCQLY